MKFSAAPAALCGSAMFFAALTGCERQSKAQPAPPPLPVTVARPITQEVRDYEELTGRIAPVEAVELRARVGGYLDRVTFQRAAQTNAASGPMLNGTGIPAGQQAAQLKPDGPPKPGDVPDGKLQEGGNVKEGEVLFEIDPRPYVAARDAAKADLDRSKALVGQLTADLKRAEELRVTNSISVQEYEKIASNKAEADANVRSSEAKLESAELDLKFTKVTAPITGRLGRAQITAGNLVTADVTPLTTIVREDPIHVYFDMPEPVVLRYQKLIRENKFDSARSKFLPVWIGLQNERGFPHEGVLDFIDNLLEAQTGTLRLRAIFANPLTVQDVRTFTPGMFVRVRLPASMPYEAMLVSERAITANINAKYVFVVDDQGIAHRREVQVGTLHDGLRVVTAGLSADERVVVNGLLRVRDGAKVQPTEGPMIPPSLGGETMSASAAPSSGGAAAAPQPTATPTATPAPTK